MEVTIEMVLSKPFGGHLNKSHSKYFLFGSAFEHVGLCTNHQGKAWSMLLSYEICVLFCYWLFAKQKKNSEI